VSSDDPDTSGISDNPTSSSLFCGCIFNISGILIFGLDAFGLGCLEGASEGGGGATTSVSLNDSMLDFGIFIFFLGAFRASSGLGARLDVGSACIEGRDAETSGADVGSNVGNTLIFFLGFLGFLGFFIFVLENSSTLFSSSMSKDTPVPTEDESSLFPFLEGGLKF
jgi:hypothetical protein